MEEELRQRLSQAWRSREAAGEIGYAPATEKELADFECEFGPIPPDFRWFLRECGGGPVGREWVDGIRQLTATHRRHREEAAQGFWKALSDVFGIGWDGWGNLYGLHLPTGRIVAEDHEFGGGLFEMSPSFTQFLKAGLLEK
jgi:hypothetical protein